MTKKLDPFELTRRKAETRQLRITRDNLREANRVKKEQQAAESIRQKAENEVAEKRQQTERAKENKQQTKRYEDWWVREEKYEAKQLAAKQKPTVKEAKTPKVSKKYQKKSHYWGKVMKKPKRALKKAWKHIW
jgi:hypothetical protein